jgi:hypothetical protein
MNKEAVLSGKYTDKELVINGVDYNKVPPTSDVSYVAVATAAVIAVLAGAAVVILRKKSENN